MDDDPAGADGADRDGRLVLESDAGRRGDLHVGGHLTEGPKRRRDGDFAIEPGAGGTIGEGDEPFGGGQIGHDLDACECGTEGIVGLERDEGGSTRSNEPVEVVGSLGIESARHQLRVVPAVRRHSGDHSQGFRPMLAELECG